MGHIARMQETRLEKQMLYAWLPHEASLTSYKGATCSRHVFWQRISELLAFSDLEQGQWAFKWQEVAQRQGGIYWKSLIRKWVTSMETKADQDTWQARHADVARAGRKQAAYDCAFTELGVHRREIHLWFRRL